MSKKTEATETTEAQSVETVETTAATVSEKPKKPRRMGVYYFLQLHEQNYYIAALMRVRYASAVMTEDKWLAEVEKLRKERVRG